MSGKGKSGAQVIYVQYSRQPRGHGGPVKGVLGGLGHAS